MTGLKWGSTMGTVESTAAREKAKSNLFTKLTIHSQTFGCFIQTLCPVNDVRKNLGNELNFGF